MFKLKILICVFGELRREPYRSEDSDRGSCLVDAQLHIHLGSSVCADVTAQVYRLDHIFQDLVLNSYCLVGIGVDPHDFGLSDIDTEA